MGFKLKRNFSIIFISKKNNILISDDIDEQDQKQFVQKNLEYFHLFYNLFQNTSYYFVEQTKEDEKKFLIRIIRKNFFYSLS
jgi:hypothetical protein